MHKKGIYLNRKEIAKHGAIQKREIIYITLPKLKFLTLVKFVKLPTEYSKLPAVISSPDSSGSPLLGVGNGQAAATADSGTHHDTRRNRRLQIKIIDDGL